MNITRNLPNRPSQTVERTSKFSNLTLVIAQLSHLIDKLTLQRLRIRLDLLRRMASSSVSLDETNHLRLQRPQSLTVSNSRLCVPLQRKLASLKNRNLLTVLTNLCLRLVDLLLRLINISLSRLHTLLIAVLYSDSMEELSIMQLLLSLTHVRRKLLILLTKILDLACRILDILAQRVEALVVIILSRCRTPPRLQRLIERRLQPRQEVLKDLSSSLRLLTGTRRRRRRTTTTTTTRRTRRTRTPTATTRRTLRLRTEIRTTKRRLPVVTQSKRGCTDLRLLAKSKRTLARQRLRAANL